jgi:hypothetical protein
MLNYYHHSLREIVAIAFIFIDDTHNINILLELFKKENMTGDNFKEKIDSVFEMLEKELYILNNKKYIPEYPMVGDKSLFEALIMNNADNSVRLRIRSIQTKQKMVKFLHLLNTNPELNIEVPL